MQSSTVKTFNICILSRLDGLKQRQYIEPYRIVLMDYQMPDMDGYQATRQITLGSEGNGSINIPIITMAANSLKGDDQKHLDAGYIQSAIRSSSYLRR